MSAHSTRMITMSDEPCTCGTKFTCLAETHDIPKPSLLPCGCLLTPTIIDGERTIVYSPCSMDCVNLRNATGLAREVGKPVRYEKE